MKILTPASIITCPNCLGTQAVEIPQGYSQHLYRCPSCSCILKPKSVIVAFFAALEIWIVRAQSRT